MRRGLSVLLVGAACLACVFTAAAEPVSNPTAIATTEPKPDTSMVRLAAVRYSMLERMVIDGYENTGIKNPKWDAEARVFLKDVTYYLSFYNSWRMSWPDDMKPIEQVVQKGSELARTLECQDPLVLHLAFWINMQTREYRVGMYAPYKKFSDAMERSDYHPLLKYDFMRMGINQGDFDIRESCRTRSWRYAAEAAKAPLNDESARFIADRIIDAGGYRTPQDIAENYKDMQGLVEQLRKDPNVDPWIREYLSGQLEIKEAWNARGGDLAGNVSSNQWKGFQEHLAQARTHFTDALALRPNCPEPAAAMVRVAMGAYNDELQQWFDRAVAISPDYNVTYDYMFLALYSKWLGSTQSLINFADKCLQTKRYDTRVPYYGLIAYYNAVDDAEDPGLWKRPDMNKKLDTMLAEYEKLATSRWGREWCADERAALAWRSERYGDFVAHAGRIADPMRAPTLAKLKLPLWRIIPDMRAEYGPHGRLIKKAKSAIQTHQWDTARDIYNAILQDALPDDSIRQYIASQMQALNYLEPFHKGEWVDLTPNEKLEGWIPVAGTWERKDNGAIIGTATDNLHGMLLLCPVDFGDRYELTGRIDSLYRYYKEGGAVLGYVGPESRYLLKFFTETGNTASLERERRIAYSSEVFPWKEHRKLHTFRLVVDGLSVAAYIEDKLLKKEGGDTPDPTMPPNTIGLSSQLDKPGEKIQFTNLKIRKLPAAEPGE